jgi:two-component system sensor histidine kinase/response regulator
MATSTARRQRTAIRTPDAPDDVTPSPTVLVVDDRVDNLEAAKTALEAAGYRVLLASGGEPAIALFVVENPDCILLDVRMPDLDGFAVCERIRAHPRGVDTPIIFLTALRDVDTFDQALRVGGDDFLTKPMQSGELLVRVQSALKLRRMRAELREHYDLLKHQRDALQRVQLQKERLMAFLVHDLKNPVSSIDLHAQVLLRDKELPPALQESAAHIRTEARHLTRMILNLLDLSKAAEGRLAAKMSSVDVRRVAAEVVDELAVTAQSREVTLECAADIDPIRADEDLLRRALTNLLENALRHAPAGTVVKLTAATHANGTDFRIIDAGAGVPPEMRELIFDPFVQVDGGSDRPPPSRSGRGLGLTFCKLTAEAHAGRIWVEDAAPGAAFCLRLPHQAWPAR